MFMSAVAMASAILLTLYDIRHGGVLMAKDASGAQRKQRAERERLSSSLISNGEKAAINA